ncbi:MAG TPA: homocysteine S-methyltransferase family protein [Terriglobia bacterium]|nr:homocysteine S-methyltransferase family protein [Terriglobia bacterium]
MKNLMERISDGEILISDGALGTLLQAKGLKPGECPESWCLSHPEVLKGIAQAYLDAGSDIVTTNSFGGTSYKLEPYGYQDKVRDFNRAAATLVKQVMRERGYVAGSVGPTGRIVVDEGGDVRPEDLYRAFSEQVAALAEGGADAICIETMSSLVEATQAIKAAKDHTRLPVLCTFTFAASARGFHTMMGASPERAAQEAAAAGADVVGANCGNGIVNMIEIARAMRAALPRIPILIQANAGAPVLEGDKTVFKETPEFMASHVRALMQAGANIIGGCCGTTPAHIAAMARVIRRRS